MSMQDKISIYESDITKRTSAYDVTSNAVYIPGFSSKADAGLNDIKLCTTIKEFEEAFGKNPFKFTVAETVGDTTYKADSYDNSYIYAKELIRLGLPVYYEAFDNSGSTPIQAMYTKLLNSELIRLLDKNEFNLKFITTGAYENFNITDVSSIDDSDYNNLTLRELLLTIATKRGDAVSLIDYAKEKYKTATEVYNAIKEDNVFSADKQVVTAQITSTETHNEYINNYGTVIVGWGIFDLKSEYTDITNKTTYLPGSFAYLKCLALSTQNYPNYYAIAGVTRGLVKDLNQPSIFVTGAEADLMQPDTNIAINPITKINPYGYCIWGNRTLHKNDASGLVASSFLNLRLLSCDVKKIVRHAALALNFEINSDVLWLNFKAKIEPELDKIVANNGIEKYKLTRISTTERATVKAKVTLWCLYAVEKWDIEIELTDSYVSVE